MEPEIDKLCDFLVALKNGELGREDGRSSLSTLMALRSPELEELSGNLHHYIDDADIRTRDAGYREFQDSEMGKLISRLRSGDIPNANRVTFLERT